MRIFDYERVHFVGIGGIGMSGLAQFLHDTGVAVSGSDMQTGTMTAKLLHKKIIVTIGHKADHIDDSIDLVVRTLAVPLDNPEIVAAHKLGIPVLTYPEALGQLTKEYTTIAVAGTHGKTTTTAMIAKVLLDAGLDPSVIVGSTADFLGAQNYRVGSGDFLVIEACEYQSDFSFLHPDIVLITNVEHDHFDAFPTPDSYYNAFAGLITLAHPTYGVVLNTDFAMGQKLATDFTTTTMQLYGKADLEQVASWQLPFLGEHNRLNALGAWLVVQKLGVDQKMFMESLAGYKTPSRRLEYKFEENDCVVFSDYGHHPTEIKATLQALREKYSDEKIAVVYQAHQFSRTLELLDDFAEAFNLANQVFILPIYAARDSEATRAAMPVEKLVATISADAELWQESDHKAYRSGLQELCADFDVIVVMGAGSIEGIFFGE